MGKTDKAKLRKDRKYYLDELDLRRKGHIENTARTADPILDSVEANAALNVTSILISNHHWNKRSDERIESKAIEKILQGMRELNHISDSCFSSVLHECFLYFEREVDMKGFIGMDLHMNEFSSLTLDFDDIEDVKLLRHRIECNVIINHHCSQGFGRFIEAYRDAIEEELDTRGVNWHEDDIDY